MGLGESLMGLGEYEEAKMYFEKVLKVREEKLGKDHVKTQNVRKNLEKVNAMIK